MGYSHLCSDCARSLYLIKDPRCETCGYPFFGDTESHVLCPHCEGLRPAFDRGVAVALFKGPLRDLIYALKYEAGLWALDDLREIAKAAPGLGDFLSDSVLVPVPLHPRKLRERGYNQSVLLARELCVAFENVEIGELLQRQVDTPSQTQFNRIDRRRNLKNAFSLRQNRAIYPTKRYIIVDDVFTTGSTINACASALKSSGAKWVEALTLGHG